MSQGTLKISPVAKAQYIMFASAAALNIAHQFSESGNPQSAIQTFYDFHVGNYFDPISWGSILNCAAVLKNSKISYSSAAAERTGNRAVFTAMVAGFGYETMQSQLPKREFDYVDCGMYVAGALTFVAVNRWARRLG